MFTNTDLYEPGAEIQSKWSDSRMMKWREKVDRVLSWFRSCAVCSSFQVPVNLLCDGCWKKFEEIRNRGEWLNQPGYPFRVYSILTWTPENDGFVRALIYALKTGKNVEAYEKLIHSLVYELRRERREGSPLFYFPGSSTGVADHSEVMSELVAAIFQADPVQLQWDERSLKTKLVRQKQLSAAERTKRRFCEARGEAKLAPPHVTRVFIDDVVTSGATAMAAYMALGNPERFEVWTLVCRPKLATTKAL